MKKRKSKYRLRLNKRIIGYAESTKDGLLFNGPESFWRMRGKPNYDSIDKFVGIKDKFHRDIYELDLVNYRVNHEFQMRKAVVIYSKSAESFGLLDLDSFHFTHLFIHDICLFQSEKMEIYSHLFNHPDLEKLLQTN